MQDWSARRLKLLREEARACLHLARLTVAEAERMALRNQAARFAMQAEHEQRQYMARAHGPAAAPLPLLAAGAYGPDNGCL